MSLLAPYTSVMRLGQGFNSYTQEICIDDAVLIRPTPPDPNNSQLNSTYDPPASRGRGYQSCNLSIVASNQPEPSILIQEQCSPDIETTSSNPGVNQTVKYTAHAVDNVADIVDTLNISSSATINYGTGSALGNTAFVKENNLGESDLNFIVSVKVTNESPVFHRHIEFNPIPGLDPGRFSSVYGDSFIAGFLEGGEFSAIVCITVHDKSKVSRVKTAAEIQLSVASSAPLSGGGAFGDLDKEEIWKDTEISVAVNWSGGGDIKKPKKNWDLTTVVRAANEFPSHVAKYSQRTSAILMGYNSLRSFQEFNLKAEVLCVVLDYRLCHLYTAELLSAFMYYKALWRTISKMIKDHAYYQARESSREVPNPISCDPRSLNLARLECRRGMTMIIEEAERLAVNPELGRVNEDGTLRQPPYTFPAELALRLPCLTRHCTETMPSTCCPSRDNINTGTDTRSDPNSPCSLPPNTACQRNQHHNRTCLESSSAHCNVRYPKQQPRRRSCWPFSFLTPLMWLSPTNWSLGVLAPQRLFWGKKQIVQGQLQLQQEQTDRRLHRREASVVSDVEEDEVAR